MRKTLVVDLDETLYRINTFYYFYKFLLKNSLKKLDLKLFFVLMFAALGRVLRVISHKKLKYTVLKNTKIAATEIASFLKEIEIYKRQDLLDEFLAYELKILATGAPGIYAEEIAVKNGFDACLATTYKGESFSFFTENLKEEKSNQVSMLLQQKGYPNIDVLITDHEDDFPLIKIAKHSLIVNPSAKLSKRLQEELPLDNFTILND